MSVKIYDGLRAARGTNPFTLGVRARKVLEPLFFKEFELLMGRLAEGSANPIIRAEDINPEVLERVLVLPPGLGKRVAGSADPKHRAYDVVHSAIEALHKHPTQTFSHASIGYDLVLLPPASRPLAIIYTEHHEYRRALIESGVFEDYGYWDNSDEPEDVTPQEWGARKKAWRVLTEGDATPASAGLMITHPSRFQAQLHMMGILT